MDSSNSLNPSDIVSYMDPKLVKAAAEANVDTFNGYVGSLDLLLTPNKNTILHICITARTGSSSRCINFVNEILDRCSLLLDLANNGGETALHIAARYGHGDIVELLIQRAKLQHEDLERGVGEAREMMRKMNAVKDTALHEAVRNNHLNVVRILTEEYPDYWYTANDADETPLYLAAERGYTDIVSKILETCTAVDFHGPNGRTALHEAVINNDSEMTRRILDKNKALTRKTDQQGWTPLHHASHFGHLSTVNQLLDADKYAAYIGDSGGKRTPLHIAANKGDSHVKVMQSIIFHCPDCCELVDERGRNVVHFAVESCRFKGVEVLLKNPLLSNLINQKDNEGNTPLHLLAALRFHCSTFVRHPLVDKKAVNKENLTAHDITEATMDTVKRNSSRFHTLLLLRKAGCKNCRRNKICSDDNTAKQQRIDGMIAEFKKAEEAHLIVAALIATVTFTAGFTMPGGYNSEKGQHQGTALLSEKPAFRAFLVADGLALVFSTSAVLVHFLSVMQGNKRRFHRLFWLANWLIAFAIMLMVVAFATGTYVALPNSSSFRHISWIITTFFIVLMIYTVRLGLPLHQIKDDDML